MIIVDTEIDEKLKRYHIENEQDWKGESVRIPWMYFRSDWQVRVIPPFGDAVIRFQVILPSGTLKSTLTRTRLPARGMSLMDFFIGLRKRKNPSEDCRTRDKAPQHPTGYDSLRLSQPSVTWR